MLLHKWLAVGVSCFLAASEPAPKECNRRGCLCQALHYQTQWARHGFATRHTKFSTVSNECSSFHLQPAFETCSLNLSLRYMRIAPELYLKQPLGSQIQKTKWHTIQFCHPTLANLCWGTVQCLKWRCSNHILGWKHGLALCLLLVLLVPAIETQACYWWPGPCFRDRPQFSQRGNRPHTQPRAARPTGCTAFLLNSHCMMLSLFCLSLAANVCNRFSPMHGEGFLFYIGGLGVETCSLDAASATATVCNCRQPFATVGDHSQPSARPLWPCLWRVLQKWSFPEISIVAQLRFAWQAHHFVTFQHVSSQVENRKTILCGKRNILALFSEDAGRRDALETSIVI